MWTVVVQYDTLGEGNERYIYLYTHSMYVMYIYFDPRRHGNVGKVCEGKGTNVLKTEQIR